jgi:uncharacterized OB-fold protein
MAIRRDDFPLPDVADPVTAPFFSAAAAGELRIPRCAQCARLVWYPAPECPTCGSASMPWARVRGTGTLFSWAVVRRAFLPAFEDRVPFVSGLVALSEDPAVRLVTYLVDASPAELAAEQEVEVVFRPLVFSTVPNRAVTVPMFRPARPSAADP